MKTLSFLLLCTVCLSCGKKGVDPAAASCNESVARYQTTINAYAASPTAANCLAVKSVLSDVVNKCTLLSAQERAEYNRELDQMTCD